MKASAQPLEDGPITCGSVVEVSIETLVSCACIDDEVCRDFIGAIVIKCLGLPVYLEVTAVFSGHEIVANPFRSDVNKIHLVIHNDECIRRFDLSYYRPQVLVVLDKIPGII